MATKDISALYTQAHTEGHAIAFFRLPGARQISHISGGTVRSIKDDQHAFVFAPFDTGSRPYYIVPEGKVSPHGEMAKVKSTSRKVFNGLVRSIITAIRSGDYQKIVAARIFASKPPTDFSPTAFFTKLCHSYPAAFVSLTSIPGVGLWIGASPEVLAAQKGDLLTTYALAGTKAIEDNTPWGEKEEHEQRIVTDFIRTKLSSVTDTEVRAKGPVTREAGKLKHLLTVFMLRSKDTLLWQKVTRTLHPTPAVGGMPQAKAAKFIREAETFDRRFYAGYLGPVNWKGRTDIFVNLRCMEVTSSQLIFYAGCGIIADSDPALEWMESERKIDVLRSQI